MDWKITRGHGTCFKCEKTFPDDYLFFSALFERGDEFERRDFCEQCWEACREVAFSHWRTRMPRKDSNQKPMVDDDILLDFFARLEPAREAKKVNFRYLLGLMLMRKKRLKFEDIEHVDDSEILVMRQSGTDIRHRVIDPALSQEQFDQMNEDLHQILYLET